DDEQDSECEIEEEELDLSSNSSDVKCDHTVDSPFDDALAPEALRSKTTQLINDDPCQAKCLTGKTRAIELFLNSIEGMSKDHLRFDFRPCYNCLHGPEAPSRQWRARKVSVIPSFATKRLSCFGTSARTVVRLRKQIDGGNFGLQAHGGSRNKNARNVDAEYLSEWFQLSRRKLANPFQSGCERRKQPTVSDIQQLLQRITSSYRVTLRGINFAMSTAVTWPTRRPTTARKKCTSLRRPRSAQLSSGGVPISRYVVHATMLATHVPSTPTLVAGA
ncbi:TPA: LOW QUALITY PROTEIN: hypothetical protein N0F65_009345, partial [Lagenidium giganteum]